MNTPLVSIVIPTYNRPDFLRRAIESCLAQTHRNFEIVITDNSVKDDSARMLAKISDPRIRYFSNGGNIGPWASSNRGVALASGKYIKFLMDDDLLKPRCLELMVAALERNPSAAIAMAPMELIDENDVRICPRFYLFRRMRYRFRYRVGDAFIERRRLMRDFLTREYPCTVPSGMMLRTEALRAAGPFLRQAEFAGDLEMWMRIGAVWDACYIDEVLAAERHHVRRHTATLHQTGLNIRVFYFVTRKSLDNPAVQGMFREHWAKMVRDSLFFCSCRALLNGAAALRTRNVKLIADTIRTIMREDPHPANWLRLPLFVAREVFVSLFPRRLPPAREAAGASG